LAVGYAAALAMVAIATLLAFIVKQLITAPNLTLIFVLPVVVTATTFGWRPAFAASVAGVLAFDFFFTTPFNTLRITSPSDIWAATLLLAIATIVSVVAARSRQQAIEAARAADRAETLRRLAHLVVASAPGAEVSQATADALSRIFEAPAIVLTEVDGRLQTTSAAGGGVVTPVDVEAAIYALQHRNRVHGDAYPFEAATFDFWPICREGSPVLVLGVGDVNHRSSRPDEPERYVELAGAYLISSLTGPTRSL
jgi:K+-sensing histidine kinase KdpD